MVAGGPHCVVAATTPHYLTDVESVNLGLRQTRGSWIHLLGRDTPTRDFYSAMIDAVMAPGVALAVAHEPPLDRALDLDFSLRPSCFVAARDVYKRAGGLCATMPLAAAWELVQRLVHAALPATFVSVRVDPPASRAVDTTVLAGYGESVLHWLAAIDLAQDIAGLSAPDVAVLHERCAAQGSDLARDDMEKGRFASALATVAETLRVPLSPAAHERLTASLARSLR
jgi:hypothetical protein